MLVTERTCYRGVYITDSVMRISMLQVLRGLCSFRFLDLSQYDGSQFW